MGRRLKIAPDRYIGDGKNMIKYAGIVSRACSDDPVFIVAEIGQNHQGCLNTAKKMIVAAKTCGCDCVKFQKSSLKDKFNKAALRRSYVGRFILN